jgi:asparagine synthase (glutamine-hydrolysing)
MAVGGVGLMCGIVGFWGQGTTADLTRMMDALAHRGPDGAGRFEQAENQLFLGHRRLAVVDISGGAQPMWNEDGSVGIIFNGEIYNHAELRRELIARGHQFATDHSDTEALVHGYEEWGEGLPLRLNGMFAFCIVDLRRQQLVLARDRFGEKPLYFIHQNGVFAFASEASAFRAHCRLRLELDGESVQKFLACGFLSAPRTIYRDVQKLPAGSLMIIRRDGQMTPPRSFWEFRIEPMSEAVDDSTLEEEFRTRLDQAVRRRLLSDVPLGIFLSGGLDSSAITAAASRVLPAGHLETFTIGFDEASYDERKPAATVAAHYHTRHHVKVLSMAEALGMIDAVLGRMDEPIADPSILPTYLLSRFTRDRVTVALSGDGGDEMLAGYDTFAALGLAQACARYLPRGMIKVLENAARWLPRSGRNMSIDFKIRRALGGLVHPPEMWNPAWIGPVAPEIIGGLFERPLPAEELYAEPIALWNSRPDLSVEDRTLEFYTRFYLTENILFKVDRAAMLNSLESRAVFLDNDLVDFCRRLPYQFKYRRGESKRILRQALAGRLTPDILQRPKKGFGIPIAQWLRAMPNIDFKHPLPGLRESALRDLQSAHRAGRADHRGALWCLLALAKLG